MPEENNQDPFVKYQYRPEFPVPARYEKAKIEDVPERIKTCVDEFKASRKGIFISGGVGTGKTHIAYAIAKHIYGQKINVQVWNSAELMDAIRRGYDKPFDETFEDLMKFRGLLILDDVGSEKLTEWVAERFYLLVNRKYNQMVPIVITSNFNIQQLAERIGERIASRIVEMCHIVELTGEDRRLQ